METELDFYQTVPTDVTIGTDCVVCDQADIRGQVSIGNGTIIHPKARIIAEAGPIIIGDCNLIEENALIWNKVTKATKGSTPVMIIGTYNVFEVFSHCEALKIGDGNIFEPKCFVGREVVITDNCVIGAACVLVGDEILPKQTSVSGSSCQRTKTLGHTTLLQQMETLAKTLPLYNAVTKRQKSAPTTN